MWCGRETKLVDDECADCADKRYWMESDPPRSLKLAAHMLSAMFTKHNKERGRKIDAHE
jgi:hypothetical protein